MTMSRLEAVQRAGRSRKMRRRAHTSRHAPNRRHRERQADSFRPFQVEPAPAAWTLHLRRRARRQFLRTGEGNTVHVGMIDDRLAHASGAHHHVEDAGRRAGFENDVSQRGGHRRRRSRRLHHHGKLPNASAGAVFQAGIAIGKFHGVMRPNTPTASRNVDASTPGRVESRFCP